MYREITLHDLQVRVYGDGKTIQVLRCNGWVNLKYKESHGYPTITLKKNSLRKSYKVSRIVRCIKLKNYSTIQGLCKKFKISKPSYYRIKKAHFL